MAKKILRLDGDPILRKTSKPVKEVNKNILRLLEDMKDTMYDAQGVGLAAVQIGSLRRVVLVDIGEGLYEMINPEIIEADGIQVSNEGCLSIPGYVAHVDRPMQVRVKYFDRQMQEQEVTAEGYLAVAMCHELDHLDGILFKDKSYELEEDEYEETDEAE